MSESQILIDHGKAIDNAIRSTTGLHRKIKCPRHYILKPGGVPFMMERIPALKNISVGNARALGIKLWRRKRDKFGKWIQNFADYYQPDITAAEARMRIYNPSDPICAGCKRCVTA